MSGKDGAVARPTLLPPPLQKGYQGGFINSLLATPLPPNAVDTGFPLRSGMGQIPPTPLFKGG